MESLQSESTRAQTIAPAEMARRILREVMAFRRVPHSFETCAGANCAHCSSVYLPNMAAAVAENKPVIFVLPAFPGKSPNPEKVLGPLPDQAERLALNFLGHLCRKIKKYYAPGIRIILCSDGRVFSDVVGMKENDVSAYQAELDRLIQDLLFSEVSTFNLDDVYGGLDFAEMREALMKRHGKTSDDLKEEIRQGADASRMYLGITRFIFEDSLHAGQTKSRTSLQKEARVKAYEVIRRSNAWSELIAERFPHAVRLSIHPQTCGSKKLGIRLVGDESWMTPWHGVAVETSAGYILLKRSEAENMGAQLVHSANGRASHFKLVTV